MKGLLSGQSFPHDIQVDPGLVLMKIDRFNGLFSVLAQSFPQRPVAAEPLDGDGDGTGILRGNGKPRVGLQQDFFCLALHPQDYRLRRRHRLKHF